MKRKISAVLCIMMAFCLVSAGCAQETVNVFTLKGPTGIGMVKMMDDNDGTYEFTLCGAPDEAVAAIVSDSADIAAVPTNLAATLFQKTGGNVQMLALNTLGVLSILENGNDIGTVEDLAGKTIYATGQGSTPEYVLNYILKAYGIDDKVTVVYYAEHSELATLAAAGKVDLVMLPEPHVTSVLTQNKLFRVALDVTEIFGAAAAKNGLDGAEMSMGCVIARKDFVEKNPEKVARFLTEYESSVNYVNDSTEEAAKLVEAQGIMPKAAVAMKAIPNCHIVFISGQEMQDTIKPFFQILFDASPKAVGGAMPDDSLYYVEK